MRRRPLPWGTITFGFWLYVALVCVTIWPSDAQMRVEVTTGDVPATSFAAEQFSDRFAGRVEREDPPPPVFRGAPTQDIRVLVPPGATYTRKWLEANGFGLTVGAAHATGKGKFTSDDKPKHLDRATRGETGRSGHRHRHEKSRSRTQETS